MKEYTFPFLVTYTKQVYKWISLQGGIVLLGILFFLFAFVFVVTGRDGYAAGALALAFVCFFILYSLSFTLRELLMVQALECKKEIEPLYDFSSKEMLFECVEHYCALATQVRKLAFQYESDSGPYSLSSLLNRVKRFFFWKEFHLLEEICLLEAIDLITRQVRSTPCDIEVHARLANAFIVLQNHFLEPIKAKEMMKKPSLLLLKSQQHLLQEKATQAARLAVEELEIMSSYAPDEIWVHEQLAISYRELNLHQKEMTECERLLALNPDDPQVLLRLGALYFKTGLNGKGLKMYELLKAIDPHLGKELIASYGSYDTYTCRTI